MNVKIEWALEMRHDTAFQKQRLPLPLYWAYNSFQTDCINVPNSRYVGGKCCRKNCGCRKDFCATRRRILLGRAYNLNCMLTFSLIHKNTFEGPRFVGKSEGREVGSLAQVLFSCSHSLEVQSSQARYLRLTMC